MLISEVSSLLKPPQNSILLVITVGNSFRSDDGVGPYIAQAVKSPIDGIRIIDAGSRPEDVVFDAVDMKPARIVIIDAADFGGNPGEIAVIPDHAIDQRCVSTHSIPLSLFSSLLREDTGAEVIFIGIQKGSADFGEDLTEAVKMAAEEAIKQLIG